MAPKTVLAALLASLPLCGCDAISDAVSVDGSRLLTLTGSSTTVPADGETVVTIRAELPAMTPPVDRDVTFRVSSGTIVGAPNNGRELTVTGVRDSATILLRAPSRAGDATVLATSGSLAQALDLRFVAVLPSEIALSTDDAVLDVSDEDLVNPTARLLRGPGFASEGTPVEFSAIDSRGRSIGGFAGVTSSNASGVASATFSVPPNTVYRGTVSIVAVVRDPETGGIIESRIAITLVD